MPVESGVLIVSSYDVQATSMTAFTVDDALRLRIDQASCRNYGTVDSVLSVWLIQSAQGEGNLTNATQVTLTPGQEVSIIGSLIGRSVSNGGTIVIQSSVANTLTVSITGTNYT